MQTEPSTTLMRKRKFKDVLLPDAPNEHPLKFSKFPDKREVKLEIKSMEKTNDFYPTILPSLSQSSAAQKMRSLPAKSKLCRRCAKIDLDKLLSRPHKTYAGQLANTLSPARDWDIDSCHLCSLLYSTIDVDLSSFYRRPLRTFSSNKMEDKLWCSINTNLLRVGYGGRYIVSQPEGITGPVKIIKENIDSFDIVKKWINLCQSQHTKTCSKENRSSVLGLRLIDCHTRTIVPAEANLYVALSYVWGYSSETSGDPNNLPEDLPHTIEDAVTVTKRLGYRYIWIDRYCIDQKNGEGTADQIEKMDLIYHNAELTIIAAIGEDPSYGLPGVSQRKRNSKYLTTCAKIGRHFLISTDSWPKGATANTKWETRAWTYQEALLSRRRLVFSKQQMYFECYGMYCCESLDLPLENLHRKDMQGFKSVFCSDKMVGIFPKGVGTTAIEIFRRIEEYSKLNLTNPSDILKGMLGIFNAFQRSRLHIHHYAGIPILNSMPERNLGKLNEGWTPSMGFLVGLLWCLETRSERRHGFPSWCWTGWHGPVKWKGSFGQTWPSINVDPSIEVNITLVDGRKLTLETFQALHSHSSLYTQLSNTIHITAWTIEVKILRFERQRDNDKYSARLNLENGGCLDWSFGSTSMKRFIPSEFCKGIILGHDFGCPQTFQSGPAILVCDKVGDTMERIGIGWVDVFQDDRSGKDRVCEIIDNLPITRFNSILEGPLELVKSWEEVQLG